MPIPTEITLPVTTIEPTALFLCEMWASATTDDGHKLELDRAGGVMILTITNPDGERRKQTISVEDLVFIWAKRNGIRVDAEQEDDRG